MAARGVLVGLASVVVLFCFLESCSAEVLLSTLPRALLVNITTPPGTTLKATKDKITVTWTLNSTFFTAGKDDVTFKTIKTKLCYAKISQKDRGWRKTVDDLKKDKTCQFSISAKPYSLVNNTATWTIEAKIPQATYFVRAYAFDAAGVYVGYGETPKLTTNLFIEAVTGRHASLDIASVVFSAFSVVSLAFFFIIEKKKAKNAK